MTKNVAGLKSIGDRAYVFMTSGAFDKHTKVNKSDIMFLAKVTIRSSDWHSYSVLIDEIIFEPHKIFKRGEIHNFAHLWIDRGEEAFNIFNNPSYR